MADRSIVVRLRAEVSDFKRQLGEASTAVDGVGKKAQETAKKSDTALGQMVASASRHEEAWTKVGGTLIGIGTAAAAGVGIAVAKYAEFDEAMSHVQAATHETAANMDLLRDASIDAGASTQYSATEAAGAVEELAKAGVSTTAILGGGLAGALDLAAAGTLDVAEAAEIAATAMTMFNLEGDQVPHIADLLAAGAGKAQGSVQDMGMALKQAGLVASQTGLSIEETTGGIAAFASAGLIGSDSGTAFKSMLQRLTPQSEEAQRAMDDLGLSAYDSQGEFVGLTQFAGRLQSALKDLTPEQRNATMATIFGSDAVRAAAVLYNQGASGIQTWVDAVDDSGYAAETAALNTDNLRGDVERLGGALDTALIKTGEASNGVLRSMTGALTSVIDRYGEADPVVQSVTLAIGGAVAAVGLLGGGFLVLAPRIVATRAAMQTLSTSMPKTTAALGKVGKAAGLAGVALSAMAASGGLFSWGVESASGVAQTEQALLAVASGAKGADDAFANLTTRGGFKDWFTGNDIKSIEDAWKTLKDPGAGQNVNNVLSSVLSLGQATSTNRTQSEAMFKTFDDGLASLVQRGSLKEAKKALDGLGIPLRDQQELLPLYFEALAEVDVQQELNADSADGLTDATEGGTEAFEKQVAVMADLIEHQTDLAGVVLSVRDAQRAMEESYASATEALEDNGQTLDITTEKGRSNQAALDDIAASGWDLIASMEANGSTQEELQGQMLTTRDRFMAAAAAFGMTEDEARELANQLGLIPANVTTAVTLSAAEARAMAADMQARYDGLGRPINTVATLTIRGYEAARAAYDGLGRPIQRAGGGIVTRAEGGYISGPGTSTSDSIPALLSDGEYVVKAAAVNQYGTSFFDGLNAQRFATGGFVGGSSSRSAPSTPSLAGLSIEGTLDLGGGLIGTLRGVVRDELDTAVRGVRAGVR